MDKQLTTECKSKEGITIGLVDAIISVARVAASRLLCRWCGKPEKEHMPMTIESREVQFCDRNEHTVFSPVPAPEPECLQLSGRLYGLQEAAVIAGKTSIGLAIYERIKFIEANQGIPVIEGA